MNNLIFENSSEIINKKNVFEIKEKLLEKIHFDENTFLYISEKIREIIVEETLKRDSI